jgi:hypothetical protein
MVINYQMQGASNKVRLGFNSIRSRISKHIQLTQVAGFLVAAIILLAQPIIAANASFLTRQEIDSMISGKTPVDINRLYELQHKKI